MPRLVMSMRIRWLSVPPELRAKPRTDSAVAKVWALATICRAYSLNSALIASLSATAIAAVVLLCGPPCKPGNTALSRASAYCARHKIIPPRGPRSDL